MIKRFGTYPWFLEHGLDMIHPDDLERFKKESNNCKVFERVDVNDNYMTLKYGDNIYRVKDNLFREVKPPKFFIGQKVGLLNKEDQNGIITDMFWHYNNEEYFYFLEVNGKKKSRRYLESELAE